MLLPRVAVTAESERALPAEKRREERGRGAFVELQQGGTVQSSTGSSQ